MSKHQRVSSDGIEPIGEKHNWRKGKEKYGQIRAGQLWRKRDVGIVMVIVGKNRANKWTVDYMKDTRKSSHTVPDRNIWKYYDKISK